MEAFIERYSTLSSMVGDSLRPEDYMSRFIRVLRPEIGDNLGSAGVTEFKQLVERAIAFEANRIFRANLGSTTPTADSLSGDLKKRFRGHGQNW